MMVTNPPKIKPSDQVFVDRAFTDFEPIRLAEIELSEPIAPLESTLSEKERPYKKAYVLVRLYTHPIGAIEVEMPDHTRSADDLCQQIWAELRNDINTWLSANKLPKATELPTSGLQHDQKPTFLIEREKLLENAPMISVVVPTRDRADSLEICIDSLLAMEYPSYEVIIVDNAPSDDATEKLVTGKYDDERLHYIREDRPGTSIARNRMIEEVKNEIIAFVDDDVRVDKHWLTGIAFGFSKDENIACVNGLVMPGELETPPQRWFEDFGGFNRGYEQRLFDMKKNRPDSLFFPFTVGVTGTGANMALRKSMYKQIGGSDPWIGPGQFVRSGEDIDVYFRLVRAGYTIVYEPTAFLYHYHRKQYEKLRKQIHGYGLGFTALLMKCLLTNPLMIPGFLLKLPYGVYLMLNPKSVHNEKRSSSYPGELKRLEWLGMMVGPYAFMRQKWQQLFHRKKKATPVTAQSKSSDKDQALTMSPEFRPTRIMAVELSEPLQPIEPQIGEMGQPYGKAIVLVRLNNHPVGMATVQLKENEAVSPQQLSEDVWRQVGSDINAYLKKHGQESVNQISVDGMTTLPEPVAEDLKETPLATVIICTRERPDDLRLALNAVTELDYPNYEILIVDNAPKTDATHQVVTEDFGDNPKVRYVREDMPGLSRARNCGVRHAKGEIIAFTDDDVKVDRKWLTGIVHGFQIEDNVACVTGVVMPAELETQTQDWFEQFGGFNKGFTPRIYDNDRYRDDRPFYPYSAGLFGTGANMAFSKKALQEVGDFDPALGAGTITGGGEDLIIYVELILRGYRVVYEPYALVYHYHRKEYQTLQKQLRSYGIGFTAYLTSYFLSHPARIPGFAIRIPYGLYLALSPTSFKNASKLADYPEELTSLERRGMIYGPLAYIRSWLQQRRKERDARKNSNLVSYLKLT